MMEARMNVWARNRLRINSDGKGVRTLIAAYGCPLKCKYCLNPKSWDERTNYKNVTVDELFEIVKVDFLYMQATGGGVTFGGGEPLLYPEFIRDFANKYMQNLSVDIETSMNVPLEHVQKVADIISHWFIDIKDMNPDIYNRYTGGDNAQVINNLKWLVEHVSPEKLTIRIPLIKAFNTDEDRKKSMEMLQEMGFETFDLFPYKADVSERVMRELAK